MEVAFCNDVCVSRSVNITDHSVRITSLQIKVKSAPILWVGGGVLLQHPKILGTEAFVEILILTIVFKYKRSRTKALSEIKKTLL